MLNGNLNPITYATKILVNIRVAQPENRYIKVFQALCTGFILCRLLLSIVPTPIQLRCNPRFGTIKIHYVGTYRFLPLKPNWVIAQKLIP